MEGWYQCKSERENKQRRRFRYYVVCHMLKTPQLLFFALTQHTAKRHVIYVTRVSKLCSGVDVYARCHLQPPPTPYGGRARATVQASVEMIDWRFTARRYDVIPQPHHILSHQETFCPWQAEALNVCSLVPDHQEF